MRVHSVGVTQSSDYTSITATVAWEDHARDPFELHFTTRGVRDPQADVPGNCLLAATFPLALHDGERRLKIETPACPMLADGLLTVHAWWLSWGFPRSPAPLIEARHAPANWARPHTTASGLLSGGVDSFHMLHLNRQLHPPGSMRRIEQVIFIHGFDFGRRKRNSEEQLFEEARQRLAMVTERKGVALGICRTNLRHITTTPGFWHYRYFGAAGAAVGHAAVAGPACFYIAGTNDVANLAPLGSHPAVDPQLSSQQLTVIHDGVRFSRLHKVRDLMNWKDALDNLRVCSVAGREQLNCGHCTKCLRTRLELLVCGCAETEAFGTTAFDPALLEAIEIDSAYEAACYSEILSALSPGAHSHLAAKVADRLLAYQKSARPLRQAG